MTAPPPIVPTRATRALTLRGRRVIVGVPGIGFRGDLRADDSVLNNGRTYVPVMGELDYYRAESQQIEVFATLVPIERVWTESLADSPEFVEARRSREPDEPPIFIPVAAAESRRLIGQRVILAVPDGFVRELRAVSAMYSGRNDLEYVRICDESQWYEWGIVGKTPTTQEILASSLWLE